MRTVKLVVIGASGVGKSSIRNQYISGRFTTGYRATIGADFITKTLPHHNVPDELVTLQIWDTAGQERFSALSSAFFRGADAVILMFDVNQPQTLDALTKWWGDFRDKAPVPDEAVDEFCCVVVGNKIDIAQAAGSGHSAVSEAEAIDYVHRLVPRPATPPSPTVRLAPPEDDLSDEELPPSPPPEHLDASRTDSIDIHSHLLRGRASRTSRSHSRSTLFRGGSAAGTMTTTHTIYHTPSSSIFDNFESALSSPAFTALSAPPSRSPSRDSPLRSPRRMPSTSSMSSAPTITPSLFIRGQAEVATTATTPESGSPPGNSYCPPPPLERYPKLFFTSAKTGEGVKDVFEYIARRVVVRQEHEEALEARTMYVHDADQSMSIHLSLGGPDKGRWASGACCGS
ncbi:ras-domain-containing protein [Trametes versicolor FP-101664 SS1]|uniref:ras-domain-containing protein n=1 Tax=Trametes versicolor (strain FP-101664) TaxID=717944 RepID=UPI00046212FA|nr:ras-domain-containing protein [Trametes versicolor FP-101664 SS1]EIW65333.1 ras-domain-containing protein [Trametes versicolor FP-101664 SS1]